MNAELIRRRFEQAVGEKDFRRFVRELNFECHEKQRLRFWQEQIWAKFLSAHPEYNLPLQEIRSVLRICDLHRCELLATPAEIEHESPSCGGMIQAQRFPFATTPFRCESCHEAYQAWITRPRPTHDFGFWYDDSDWERAAIATTDGVSDSEWAEFGVVVQPGDELWRFRSPDWTWRSLCGRAGVALVRSGTVIESRITSLN